MSASGHENDPRLRRRLRAVPLPPGLIERLRRVALADDDGLDEAVCEVALPAGMLGRLYDAMKVETAEDVLASEMGAQVAEPDHVRAWEPLPSAADEVLDDAIRNVPVPEQLVASLCAAVLDDDAALDAALCEVPQPPRLVASLRRRAWRSPPAWAMRWAVALSMLVAVSLAYGWFFLTRHGGPGDSHVATKTATPTDLPPTEAAGDSVSPPDRALAADPGPSAITAPRPLEELAPRDRTTVYDEVRTLLGRADPSSGEKSLDPMLDATVARWGGQLALGARGDIDGLPDLKKVAGPTPQGIKPPLVPGFPLDFYARTGVHPFVSPSAHTKLRSATVPLGIDTASYELTRRYLEDGELPPADKIRTEEFIHAIDYAYPPPRKRDLGLSAYGGPSPFGVPGALLMQVAVQARAPADTPHPPRHLVIALDVSASMRWGGRLEMVRPALAKLVRALHADDRLSLVVFSEKAKTLFSDVGPNESNGMLELIARVRAETSTNLAAGLQEAYAVAAKAEKSKRSVRVVLLTDGTAELSAGGTEPFEQRVGQAVSDGVRLDVVDLGQSLTHDPQLTMLAQAGDGSLFRATSADQVQWSLLEVLTGKPQLVARDARLSVHFNPKAVMVYRLLGHEASAITSLTEDHPEADFHFGQAATGMFELRLLQGNEQEVATAELSWQPLDGGARQQITQRITRKDFAATFAQSPAALQAGALAAYTAESLRNPRLPRGARPLAQVLEAASRTDTALAHQPSFADFLALVEQAEKLKPYRPTKR